MNAITLNLLAEEQFAYQQRARDPLKALVAIGVGLITLTVGFGMVLSVRAASRKTAVGELQSKLDRLLDSGVVAGEDAFRAVERLARDLQAINRGRVQCAPELALVKDLVPASVQLTHLSFSMSMESPAVQPAVGDPGADGTGKRPAQPKNTERLVLQLDGRATGGSPELEVDQFLQTMRAHTSFREALDAIELRSIARMAPPAGQDKAAVPTAVFVIDCRYKEQP